MELLIGIGIDGEQVVPPVGAASSDEDVLGGGAGNVGKRHKFHVLGGAAHLVYRPPDAVSSRSISDTRVYWLESTA